jgi:hypothetical protein
VIINFFLFICLALAGDAQWWINVPACPLVIKQDRDFIMVNNTGEKSVQKFSLGCLALDDQKHFKAGNVVRNIDGPIIAKNGFYATQLEIMKEWQSECREAYWEIGV